MLKRIYIRVSEQKEQIQKIKNQNLEISIHELGNINNAVDENCQNLFKFYHLMLG